MFSVLARMSLVTRIIIAIILGIGVALVFPGVAPYLSLLGDLFIKALKSVAPVLVFVLVLASIANFKVGHSANLRPIIIMYAVGMLLAAFSAVAVSIAFPSTLFLNLPANNDLQPPSSLIEILLGTMAFVALVINPLMVAVVTRSNPYPLDYVDKPN